MDIEKLGRELEKSGKAEKLKSVASSADAKKLSAMLDAQAVERAARSGDGAAIRQILQQVLATDEGRRLAQKIGEAMK